MRRWHEFATWEWNVMVTPDMVQILAGVARNFITNVNIGRTFKMDGNVPRLGADVPRWYGETIGFWDKDALITWTSNIQGWMVHGAFEYSNKMQTDRDLHAEPRREGQVPRLESRGNFLRSGCARGASAYRSQLQEDRQLQRRRALCLHRMRADDLPGRGQSDAGVAWYCHSIRSSRYVWPSLGPQLGEVFRAGYAETAKRRYLHVQVSAE